MLCYCFQKHVTTVRIFDRGDFFTVHGQDALLASRDYFKTHSVVKMLGPKDKKLESVALNQNHFENFTRDLLIVKHYCIEIYSNSKASKNDWSIQYTASPGNLTQVEELIFGSSDITTLTGILAVKTGENNTVGCCFIDTNERKFLVSQFSDTESFINLEALVVQLSPKVNNNKHLFVFKLKALSLFRKYLSLLEKDTSQLKSCSSATIFSSTNRKKPSLRLPKLSEF